MNLYKGKIFKYSDIRIKGLSNYLEGISVAKMLGWTVTMNSLINTARKSETIQHLKKSMLKVVSFTVVSTFQGVNIHKL